MKSLRSARRVILQTAIAVALLSLSFSGEAAAAKHKPSTTTKQGWDSRVALPGTDGAAFSMAFDGKKIVLGGYILSVGQLTNASGVAVFDGEWKSLPPGPVQDPPL